MSTTVESSSLARDPLQAVPVVVPGARGEPLASGLMLIVPEAPRGRVSGFLARRLGLQRELRFELDAVGARFFREIDGRRPLAAIQSTLVREFGLEPAAARDAVIAFTAELMRRGLVALSVEPEAGGRERV